MVSPWDPADEGGKRKPRSSAEDRAANSQHPQRARHHRGRYSSAPVRIRGGCGTASVLAPVQRGGAPGGEGGRLDLRRLGPEADDEPTENDQPAADQDRRAGDRMEGEEADHLPDDEQ